MQGGDSLSKWKEDNLSLPCSTLAEFGQETRWPGNANGQIPYNALFFVSPILPTCCTYFTTRLSQAFAEEDSEKPLLPMATDV